MLFNSIEFAIFLPIVFAIYWILSRSLRLQNLFIVISSFFFYGWWDWRFLSLLSFSIIVDFFIGRALQYQENLSKRRFILWISIITNLGFLGFFKYYNFFVDNFIEAFSLFGKQLDVRTLNIILPVGISFYTFQTLSYTIDVYKRKLEPTNDIISFAAFVSFFPQLVAGPIERATNLLPQFYKRREFDYDKAVNGMRQILWGLFKKIVIADNCAEVANIIFENATDSSGSTLVLGALFFTFQIYGDFSGYSDIAIGTARLFGFGLMRNFAFPYFSRDIAEFWRRWHISLSTWFRDYLYIPLGGSRGGTWMKVRNTFVIFIVSGFWHGANWTFIIWGTLNAFYFLPLLLANRNRTHIEIVAQGRLLPSFNDVMSMFSTFSLTVFAWIFFRAENLQHAILYIKGIFSSSLFSIPIVKGLRTTDNSLSVLFVLLFVFLMIEWIGREEQFAIEKLGLKWKKPFRYMMYYLIVISIFMYAGSEQQFIYFQF
ncbi:MAG: MBOAT family protein [Chitinophagales bacterium]|nr:MBOAT family protein [Chitinophagales bacterium]